MDTSPAMLDALGLKTSDLERCQDSFMRLWRQLSFRVKTFQEGRGLTSVDIGIFNEKVSRFRKGFGYLSVYLGALKAALLGAGQHLRLILFYDRHPD